MDTPDPEQLKIVLDAARAAFEDDPTDVTNIAAALRSVMDVAEGLLGEMWVIATKIGRLCDEAVPPWLAEPDPPAE